MMTRTMPIDRDATPQNLLLGISGGVDSAVAAALLLEAGHGVTGAFLSTHTQDQQAADDAQSVCRQLGIPFVFVDARQAFQERVIDPFVDAWLSGLTPNPCVLCNRVLKFDLLLDLAAQTGCQGLATGHYASIATHPQHGRLSLCQTPQALKDQTYFLYGLSQEQLAKTWFPLASHGKAEVRQLAAGLGLTDRMGKRLAEKKDSQDLCFLPHQGYADLIRAEAERRQLPDRQQLFSPGPILDETGRTCGTHPGLIHYTLGQRKGFEVKTTDRLFVIGRQLQDRALIVGPHDHLLRRSVTLNAVVYSGSASFENGQKLAGRIRSSARPAPCQVQHMAEPDRLQVIFDQPVAAPAAGQSCVLYDQACIQAGGVMADSGVWMA